MNFFLLVRERFCFLSAEFSFSVSHKSLYSSGLRLFRSASSSDFTLVEVSFLTFSLYSTISFMRVNENSSRREYHFAQNSSSLYPIDGSKSIFSPFGIQLSSGILSEKICAIHTGLLYFGGDLA